MPAKKFKHGSYYWVRRNPSTSGDRDNPTYHVPNWEPMLWDEKAQAFYQAGATSLGIAVTALATIGEIIERRPKRVTRRGWIPTTIDAHRRRADPVYDNVQLRKVDAVKMGNGLPLEVEISWRADDERDVNAFVRTLIKHTTPLKLTPTQSKESCIFQVPK